VASNNVSGQIEQFFKTMAQGASPGGLSTNLLVKNNDICCVHRIAIEMQQGDVTNQIVEYNDIREPYNPQEFSAGISNACCTATSGSAMYSNVVSNNVAIQDSSCSVSYCWGIGIELWGNYPVANGNLIQNSTAGYPSVTFGGPTSTNVSNSPTATNNVLQGASAGMYCQYGGPPPAACGDISGTVTYTPNTISTTVSAQTSGATFIAPNSGPQSFPLTVSLSGSTNPNVTSYYTTDGTTPVPGSGTTQGYSAPFVLTVPATVKAVGMWGAGANPYSYAAGYGYVPSAVHSVTYTR
jgi:hypothetical protein